MIEFCASKPGAQPLVALSQRRTTDDPEGRLPTLGSSFLALFLQAQEGGVSGGVSSNPLELVAQASYVALTVLLILGILSIVSWALILYKWWTFGRAARQSNNFLEVFRRSSKFSEVQA